MSRNESVTLMKNRCREHPQFPMEHMHQCRKCEVVWGHTNKSQGCDACHECPKCGQEETWHWRHWDRGNVVVEYDEPVDEIPF